MARVRRRAEKCLICRLDLIPASGPKNAKGIIIGEFPGKKEIKLGKPFVGVAGNILKTELRRVGLSIYDFRITNIWQHKQNDFDEDLEWHFKQAIKEAKKRVGVLLLGSECAKMFLGRGVIEVSGLKIKKCDYISAPHIIAAPNPAILLHAGLGEFRLALDRFAKGFKWHVQNQKPTTRRIRR